MYTEFDFLSGQLKFKSCSPANYRGSYMFQTIGDPTKSFDDADFVKQYESISTLMIIANQGPIIIRGNQFIENIGTSGGAIHIYSPDFESNAGSNRTNS